MGGTHLTEKVPESLSIIQFGRYQCGDRGSTNSQDML